MPIKRIRTHLQSDFFKSLTVLLSGTLIAQAIGYAIAPILTRLYDTAEMGELALYMRITGFVAALATLRYELAVPLPKNEGHSYLLYRLSLLIGVMVLLICGTILTLFVLSGVAPKFEWWYIVMIVIGSACLILINVGTNWSIRTGTFSLISKQKIYNSFISNGLKWFFAVFSWSYFGLILATVLGYVISSFSFLKNFTKIRGKYKGYVSKRKTYALMKEHKEFPLLNLPHVIVDNGRDMLVATLIFAYFSDSIFGSFSHSYNMLRIPIMLVGVSLSQVFYNQAVAKYNNKEVLKPLFQKTTLILTAISLIPFTVLYLYGEPIFSLIFGSNWGDAGRYSETMSFWLMVNFVISPVSSLPLILGKQKIAFVLGVVSALIQVIPLWVIPELYGNSEEVFVKTLEVISYSQAVWLVFSFFVYYRFVTIYDTNLKTAS